MELFLVIFQVFHDFQSLWEPCYCPYFEISCNLEHNYFFLWTLKNRGPKLCY